MNEQNFKKGLATGALVACLMCSFAVFARGGAGGDGGNDGRPPKGAGSQQNEPSNHKHHFFKFSKKLVSRPKHKPHKRDSIHHDSQEGDRSIDDATREHR